MHHRGRRDQICHHRAPYAFKVAAERTSFRSNMVTQLVCMMRCLECIGDGPVSVVPRLVPDLLLCLLLLLAWGLSRRLLNVLPLLLISFGGLSFRAYREVVLPAPEILPIIIGGRDECVTSVVSRFIAWQQWDSWDW